LFYPLHALLLLIIDRLLLLFAEKCTLCVFVIFISIKIWIFYNTVGTTIFIIISRKQSNPPPFIHMLHSYFSTLINFFMLLMELRILRFCRKPSTFTCNNINNNSRKQPLASSVHSWTPIILFSQWYLNCNLLLSVLVENHLKT